MDRQDEIKHCEYMISKMEENTGKTDTFFGVTSTRSDNSAVYKKRLKTLNAMTDKQYKLENLGKKYA